VSKLSTAPGPLVAGDLTIKIDGCIIHPLGLGIAKLVAMVLPSLHKGVWPRI